MSCIRKHTLLIAQINPNCFVSNKAKLCRSHLSKCLNFAEEYNEDEIKEIISRSIPEDEKKVPNQKNIIIEPHVENEDNNSKIVRTNTFALVIITPIIKTG